MNIAVITIKKQLATAILLIGGAINAQALSIEYLDPLCELPEGYQLPDGIVLVNERCAEEDFILITNGAKKGAIDSKGNTVIPLEYDDINTDYIRSMPNHLIRVQKDGKIGYINHQNEVIIPIEFDGFEEYQRGGDGSILFTLKSTKDGMKKGLIYADGKPIADSIYDEIGNINDAGLIRVKLDNKYGMVNKQNQVVIPIIYDRMSFYSHKAEGADDLNVALVDIGDKEGVVNDKGEIIIDIKYDSISWFNWDNKTKQWLANVKKDDKYGVVNQNGDLVIPIEYDYISPFQYFAELGRSLATVNKDGRSGLIDPNSRIFLPFDFQDMGEPRRVVIKSDNLFIARVIKNNKFGVINEKGELVVPINYDGISEFISHNSGGFTAQVAEIKKDNKYGLIDANGSIVIPIIYDEIIRGYKVFSDRFDHILYEVRDQQKFGSYNIHGELIVPVKYDNLERIYVSDKAPDYNTIFTIIKVTNKGKYGAYNLQGVPIIPAKYDTIDEFERLDGSESWLVKVKAQDKYGVYDNNGNVIVPDNYDDIGRVTSALGVIKVKSGDKYGYVDINGKLLIPVEFDQASDFELYNNPNLWLAVVRKQDNYGVINNSGDIIIPFGHNKIIPLHLNEEIINLNTNDNYAFLNSEGVLVDLSEYETIRPIREGLLAANKEGKWGYLDSKGDEVIEFKYDQAGEFIYSGKARVEIINDSSYHGYDSFIINKKGEKVDWEPSDWPYL